MKHLLNFNLPVAERRCDVRIHDGLLNDLRVLSESIKGVGRHLVIVTQDNLKGLYAEPLKESLKSLGGDVHIMTFPEGEEHKSRHTKETLEDQMFALGLSRDTTLIALGGGVVLDVAGFVAATYCRGIPLILVPTTLLGMVDAGIGGKNGINVSHGKNLIGSIYQPLAVWIDPRVLTSLPEKEIRNGVVEMIKHGMIADKDYFDWLVTNANKLLARDPESIVQAIIESCRIKMSIVQEDEREEGPRALLNCGHTVAHALEKLTNYALSHGEAVAIGLLVESRMAADMGYLDRFALQRIELILTQFGLPLSIPAEFDVEQCLKVMQADKKAVDKQTRFVVLKNIGEPYMRGCMAIDDGIVRRNIEWMVHDLCLA